MTDEIEKYRTDAKVAAIGGPRLIEREGDVSATELVLNAYFTSTIMSLGNPAFAQQDGNYRPKTMGSVAGYNSIFKKPVLEKFRYDDALVVTDDVEINYRITRGGYVFMACPNAKVYHREEENPLLFLRNLYRYGMNIGNAVRKHRAFIRIYVPLSFLYFCYIVTLPFSLWLSFLRLGSAFWALIPLVLVFLLSAAVFYENMSKTKRWQSVLVFLLVPLHPLCYTWGLLVNLLGLKKFFRR